MARMTVELERSKTYNYPPLWTPQLTLATRRRQLERWSSLVQAYCQREKIWRLNMEEALSGPLFRNAALRKSLPRQDAINVIDWMTQDEGLQRAEWVSKAAGRSGSAWIYWKRPEEWAETILTWVAETGQKSSVLTVFELTDGDATTGQEFHGMDPEILHKALQVLVARGRAQVFGDEDQKGVKIF